MKIYNAKTGCTYFAGTVKTALGYASIVTQLDGLNEKLIERLIHGSHGKAYKHAVRLCKAVAQNHAWIN